MKTKFALVDNIRTEATKGANGVCPFCSSELIAKCGEIRVNHWAHKGIRNCDPWWEPETEWHRSWKNHFNNDWQEVILFDEETGEKHIADIRTAHNFIIEFQHSHIDPTERASREKFYKNMVWVVDGTRLKRDYPRFLNGQGGFRRSNKKDLYGLNFPDKCFPALWVGSSVPVIFDFKGVEPIRDRYDLRNELYCLFPKSNESVSLMAILSKEQFIKNIISGQRFV